MSILFKQRRRAHSVNVQCEFYHRAKQNGLTPFAEYKHLNSRFDIVLITNGYIFAIVEIKNYLDPNRGHRNVKQLNKYKGYNTPVFLCRNFDDIDPIIERCKELEQRYLNAITTNQFGG